MGPGKHAENVHAEGWSKSCERSLGAHLTAKLAAPRKFSMLADGRTYVEPVPSDQMQERPLKNPSYQDAARGWSKCSFSGAHVDPAGRLAPNGRQDSYGNIGPP